MVFTKDDPIHLFEVREDTCQFLTVTVFRGCNVTKGRIADALDIPDPYVTLSISTSPEKTQATSVIDDDPNPVWNETFTFHLDPKAKNIMEICLKDSNIMLDESLCSWQIALNKLQKDETEKFILKMGEKTEIHLELHLKHNIPTDLKYGSPLCKEEKDFLKNRKEKVLAAMKEAFGDEGPKTEDEVPVVGVLGSGGGFRAMIGFSGVVPALKQAGLLDMSCYMVGLSGSSWLMAYLYSHPNWPANKAEDLIPELRKSAGSKGIMSVLNPIWLMRTKKLLKEKELQGQNTTIVDYFGYAIKERLLHKEAVNCKLSDLEEKVAGADIPLPLYTCISVQDKVEANKWHEWLEFSPYGVTISKYGIFMPPHLFGNKFFMGRSYATYPEQPLHYLMGVWGSAFSIMFSRLIYKSDANIDITEQGIQDTLEDFDSSADDSAPIAHNVSPMLEDSLVFPDDQQSAFEEHGVLKKMVTHSSLLGSRSGHAAVIPNILSQVSIKSKKPLASIDLTRASLISTFQGVFQSHSRTQPTMMLGDAGLAFNLPFPIFLRPQRGVDIILSFDFSMDQSVTSKAFVQLKLAELWAKKHKIPFPPIDENIIKKEGLKECYIFEDKDPRCPVVIHFFAFNINFRKEKAPGVPRVTKEEREFGDFDVFASGKYSTFRFNYGEEDFNRLQRLMTYNTLVYADKVKQKILERVVTKRKLQENNNSSKNLPKTLSEKWAFLKDIVLQKAWLKAKPRVAPATPVN